MTLKEIGEDKFEEYVLKSDAPVIVDLWKEDCGPCQVLRKVLETVAEETEDVRFYSIKAADAPEIINRYLVMTLPTLLCFAGRKRKRKR